MSKEATGGALDEEDAAEVFAHAERVDLVVVYFASFRGGGEGRGQRFQCVERGIVGKN